ncbi:MAG TPA: hypothetical protein VFA33_06270 [Bryobacteraceae bacterium]|nr:hypothetical protein [Bryobacteraceae bacterium]
MDKLCARCKKPFVSWRKEEKHNPTATWHGETCPDCAPKTKPSEATLDCVQYIATRRMAARLRDGHSILMGRAL